MQFGWQLVLGMFVLTHKKTRLTYTFFVFQTFYEFSLHSFSEIVYAGLVRGDNRMSFSYRFPTRLEAFLSSQPRAREKTFSPDFL